MPRFQHFLCFTILVATITFFKVASAHVKIKPALPQIEDPLTVKDVESYTIKVVTTFLVELEKECPKTEKFKVFFEKLKAYSKYLCPVSKAKGYKSDMKAKAGSLFEAMSALISVKHRSKEGSVNKSLQREKMEAMNTINLLQSVGEKIAGGRSNKTETNGVAKLTVEQQKEMKDGILKWLQLITRIVKTNVEINLKSSSKSQTTQESKEEKSSTQTQIKRRSERENAQITALPRGSRVTNKGNINGILKSARNSPKEIDDHGNKRRKPKKQYKF
ncbi:hypothetical protein AtNW77_Chr5g0122001 [Arabidopsis thaliana]|uniref:DUF1216 domain-containing protein n=2 Tax=Arabidopsis TaxID=3701 RepID=A0A178UN69_ARATH|nr:hypothetical protein ISN45_At05g034300 [Arabidopsis thaliana x Arabidopsis arenosa]OAO94131.1 hypothetical protein AXX17_AT5G37520 [Arabidopsis thaliana]